MRDLLTPHSALDALRRWGLTLLLVTLVAILSGSASAIFLFTLDRVTDLRQQSPWFLYLLPLAGIFVVWLYKNWGGSTTRGTPLLLDAINQPDLRVPFRMAPLVLLTTLITHLFGGSAGREGTALQMGGGLAGGLIHWCRIPECYRRTLLLAGIAAGFGSVFGTPLAGTVFALEVLVLGQVRYDLLIPCLIAGLIGDLTCSAWGVQHTAYTVAPIVTKSGFLFGHFDLLLLLKISVSGIFFGLCARLFCRLNHTLQNQFQQRIAPYWLRPVVGGLLLIALTYCLGTQSYLGLGVQSLDGSKVSLLSCFQKDGATSWSWLWKLVFTAITLSSGFKGGEVTPLFFIGAALGNILSVFLKVPADLLAGLGFAAVFAGASKTPLACTLLGMELFGPEFGPYLAIACFVAYYFSGKSGIYLPTASDYQPLLINQADQRHPKPHRV